MKITVLYGGDGGERSVSLRSGERVAATLQKSGHTVWLFDWLGGDFTPQMLSAMGASDVVFPVLHGGSGEDGTLQQRLTDLGIHHFAGSDAPAAALAMHKVRAKEAVAAAGVPTTPSYLWEKGAPPPLFPLPAVAKPLCGGSSIGVLFLTCREEAERCAPAETLLVEPMLTGREYSVGVLGGKALPVVEIEAVGGRYDYAHKYQKGGAKETAPARISAEKTALLKRLAETAFRALRLRDFGRVDFRENGAGNPYFLEANTLPGMTAESLFPLAGKAAGLSFAALLEKMLLPATARRGKTLETC